MKSGTYIYSLLSRLQREGLSMKWLQGKNRDLSIIILSPDLTKDWTCFFQVWYLLDQSPWRPRIWLQEPGWWNAEQVLATDPGYDDNNLTLAGWLWTLQTAFWPSQARKHFLVPMENPSNHVSKRWGTIFIIFSQCSWHQNHSLWLQVDNNAFTAYSNFFTHTQNMCFFLQSQVKSILIQGTRV